jgi:hypothetical protein
LYFKSASCFRGAGSCDLQLVFSCDRLIALSDTIREMPAGDLGLPPSRAGGADPWKLHQPGWIRNRKGSTMNNATTALTDTKVESYARLSELAELIPEMRVGQLIAAVGAQCADPHGRGLWDATDAELLEAVRQRKQRGRI